MKEKFLNFLEGVFSLALMIAILGGGLVFILLILALFLGGARGELLATKAVKAYMPYFIRSGALAVFLGLISIYLRDNHSLSLDDN